MVGNTPQKAESGKSKPKSGFCRCGLLGWSAFWLGLAAVVLHPRLNIYPILLIDLLTPYDIFKSPAYASYHAWLVDGCVFACLRCRRLASLGVALCMRVKRGSSNAVVEMCADCRCAMRSRCRRSTSPWLLGENPSVCCLRSGDRRNGVAVQLRAFALIRIWCCCCVCGWDVVATLVRTERPL